LQAKINTLQETASRETQRADQLRKDALKAEADHLQKQSELEARLKEFARHEQDALRRVEEIRQDLAHFDQRQKELREAEAQVRRWQDVEKRLKDQLIELEEKHELMRRELKSDQATVLMFAGDLIKRIDLIDILIQRYTGQNGGIDAQLRTLRASFEDILHQHGVTEFDVTPNTEIDVALRQRIAVIESESGNAKPRIVASYRPGFVYSPPEGKEVVLRKVEVKTSSR
jgi:molecular chaperone GrpE (heat shock protein)